MLNSTPENPTKRHYADLYAREHERATALRAIRAASSEIARSQNFKGTLELVMKKAAETLPMDAGALFLFDAKTQRFETAVSHNLSQERISRITFAFNEGVPGWVVTHRQPLIINDASQDQRVHPCVVADGVKCVLAVPLLTHDHVVGVLNLFCQTTQGAFDDEALLLAQVYADQAAIFIQNARLMDGLREATTELERRVEERTRQLVQTQAQVLRAEKMAAVGRLASSVAHEVNNPLQAVALHLELIADDALTPVAQDSLNLVQLELDRIAHIVQRLLDFQRPKHGKQTLQTVSALLDAVLTLAQKQL
ncbi:MAG: GAF domain-containing protein, partial [Methylococcales bacterium]|nr:GAF domain-containing protein [Methylococcales bacterium]